MMNYNNFGFGGMSWVPFGSLLILLTVWSIFWKGLALWHSGRRSQHWWFIVFLFANTAGILEMVYLFGILKLKIAQLFSK